MHFQYVVAPPSVALPAPPTLPQTDPTSDLLRELIEVQREQLAFARAAHDAQNNVTRWQAFLNRWAEEFPGIGEGCIKAVPALERAFLKLLDEMTRRATDEENDGIDDDFSLSEFLDRYGMRVSQLGTLINVLGPIADAARNNAE